MQPVNKTEIGAQMCSHAYLLFVWGFDDDASLRVIHWNTENIFGVGKVADPPLKAGLCVFTHEYGLRKQNEDELHKCKSKVEI